jgi:hypothetical protein
LIARRGNSGDRSALGRYVVGLLTCVFHITSAATRRKPNAVKPVTQPNSVVWRTVKPKELMMSEYWFVIPWLEVSF